MGIQRIVLDETSETKLPIVRMTISSPGSLLPYLGTHVDRYGALEDIGHVDYLNRATQIAAMRLAEKVSNRKVDVELLIDPMIPPNDLSEMRLVPLIAAIADNASASVEPGPGRVLLRTWWNRQHIGVDALGVGGRVPRTIKGSLMSPCFSTRITEWDTGFGLFQANEDAAMLSGSVEMTDVEEGICFRLSLPLGGSTPLGPVENRIGLGNEEADEPRGMSLTNRRPVMSLAEMMKIYGNFNAMETIEA